MAITTDRLIIRKLREDDVEFIHKLVNQKSWLKYIGTRNVNNLDDAKNYIQKINDDMYKTHGVGLWCVTLKETKQAIGIAGLIKRDTLDHLDLGFAILDKFAKNGFISESCQAIIEFAKYNTEEDRILAIAMPNNRKSHKVLIKLGFAKIGNIENHQQKDVLNLFELKLAI